MVESAPGTVTSRRDDCAVIIPTYNAARYWSAIRRGIELQNLSPEQVLIIDSSSTDGTRRLAEQAAYNIEVIPQQSFRHGRTRQLAAQYVPDAKFLVYMTQDAALYDEDSIANLLRSFDNPDVGAAYGRQLARPQADAIETHGRLFNYPAKPVTREFEDRKTLGFRTAYFSNSFAAYRRSAFEQIGGFSHHVLVSEDVSAAARMLLSGWKIAYRSDACVIHSHHFTLRAEFSRYFDIAVHHQQERWIIERFGSVGGEGLQFVKSELAYLARNAPSLIPVSVLRSAVKYFAYQCGTKELFLPLWLKRRLSTHPEHWTDDQAAVTSEVTRTPERKRRHVDSHRNAR